MSFILVKGALQGVLKGELQGLTRETIGGTNQEALQSLISRIFKGAQRTIKYISIEALSRALLGVLKGAL